MLRSQGKGRGIPDNQLLIENGRNLTRELIPTSPYAFLSKNKIRTKQPLSKNIFIVHGTDHETMKELKAMLYEFGLNPVVLHEQPSGSRTIVEKLEKYSDVGYAFVILTPDDFGCCVDDFESPTEIKELGDYPIMGHRWVSPDDVRHMLSYRARQNVVLEFGYFMGLLGRDRVCCLHKGNTELPSDMHGIVYIPFETSVEKIRLRIMKELREAGYEIRI
jgi:predicted nucleotide-binding protein